MRAGRGASGLEGRNQWAGRGAISQTSRSGLGEHKKSGDGLGPGWTRSAGSRFDHCSCVDIICSTTAVAGCICSCYAFRKGSWSFISCATCSGLTVQYSDRILSDCPASTELASGESVKIKSNEMNPEFCKTGTLSEVGNLRGHAGDGQVGRSVFIIILKRDFLFFFLKKVKF